MKAYAEHSNLAEAIQHCQEKTERTYVIYSVIKVDDIYKIIPHTEAISLKAEIVFTAQLSPSK